jgi:predicted O-methyltransferase YrrM
MIQYDQDILDQIHRETAGADVTQFQQDPHELALLIETLRQWPVPLRSYLEIGAGSGYVAKMFDSFFRFDTIHLIDWDQHGWSSGRRQRVPNAVEWIGDSLSNEARDAIDAWGLRFDMIFIDADHAYTSVKSDTHLAMRVMANPCAVVFHDARHGEVRVWLQQLKDGAIPGLSFVRDFQRPTTTPPNTALFLKITLPQLKWDQ